MVVAISLLAVCVVYAMIIVASHGFRYKEPDPAKLSFAEKRLKMQCDGHPVRLVMMPYHVCLGCREIWDCLDIECKEPEQSRHDTCL